ncbi:MAG: hypothetical protein R3325_13860 [Thermoanaerobaculia bacterium]|nr:hypothetical protein [Thermoanaerobaculia bacterium]
MPTRRVSLERVRITRVGVGFVFLTLLVGFAAVNTGNNALYMVEAMLLALMVVSGLASRRNLRHLTVEVRAPGEVYANRPFSLRYRLASTDRFLGKRWLTLSARQHGATELVAHLPPRAAHEGRLPMALRRRGVHRLEGLRVASIFPLGIFFKVMRLPAELEILVYPEIFPVALQPSGPTRQAGERPARRARATSCCRCAASARATIRAPSTGSSRRAAAT